MRHHSGRFSQLTAGLACPAIARVPVAPAVSAAPSPPDAAAAIANSLRALQDGGSDIDQFGKTQPVSTSGGGGSGTLPGLGPCAPNCGSSGTTTLDDLGGAIGALGGGS